MALDGILQFSERFEANYHELMAHVPVNILLGPDGVVLDGSRESSMCRYPMDVRKQRAIAVRA